MSLLRLFFLSRTYLDVSWKRCTKFAIDCFGFQCLKLVDMSYCHSGSKIVLKLFSFFDQVEDAQRCYFKFLLIEGDERENAEVTGGVAKRWATDGGLASILWILHQISEFVWIYSWSLVSGFSSPSSTPPLFGNWARLVFRWNIFHRLLGKGKWGRRMLNFGAN